MKIKVVSDLHLEFDDIDITNEQGADVLILSGDICIAEELYDFPPEKYLLSEEMRKQPESYRKAAAFRYREFFRRVSAAFKDVVYVAGNHEFYHGKWARTLTTLRDECKKYPNVHFLEMDSVKIGDVTFLGGTLWTDMNKGDPLTLHAIADLMNDFHLIRNDEAGFTKLRPANTMVRFRKMVEYIRAVIEGKFDEKFVVVGHHAPSRESIHAYYRADYLMNGGYASDLSDFILDHPQIKLWTHGHMHSPSDYMIGETRIICNPRGYSNEEHLSNFNPNLVVEI